MKDLAIDARGLVKHYGAATALRHLDLQLARGELLALLGPNGAGKTTTIEICQGFIAADAGVVQVLGLDPHRHRAALRPRIGVMPQGGGAYPGVRVAEMLRLVAACAAHPVDPDWLLDVLGLAPVSRTPFKRLSGGQQQRLSLACAIVGRPELVFLDEPTAGMDPQARRLVWDLLRALRDDGVSVLLTTHLMAEAEALADTVVIMDMGTVLAAGSPATLTASQAENTSLRFSTAQSIDTAQLSAALPGDYVVEEISSGDYRIHGPVTPEIILAVSTWCAQRGVLAEELRVGRPALEDVFLGLTGRNVR